MLPSLNRLSCSFSMSCLAMLFFTYFPITNANAQIDKLGERITKRVNTKVNNKILNQPTKLQRKGERKMNEAVDKAVDNFMDPKNYKKRSKDAVKADKAKEKQEKDDFKERQKYERYAKKKGLKYKDPLQLSEEEIAANHKRDSIQKRLLAHSKLHANSYLNNFEGAFIWEVEYFNIQKTKAGTDTLISNPNKQFTLSFFCNVGAVAIQTAKKGSNTALETYLAKYEKGFEEIENPKTRELERFDKNFWTFNYIDNQKKQFKYHKYETCFIDNDSVAYEPDTFKYFPLYQNDSILLTKHVGENEDYKVELWGDLNIRLNTVHSFNTICRYSRFREDLAILQPLHMLRIPIYYAGVLFKKTNEYCLIRMVDFWDLNASIAATKAKEEAAAAKAKEAAESGLLIAEEKPKVEEAPKTTKPATTAKTDAKKGNTKGKNNVPNDGRTIVSKEEAKNLAELKYRALEKTIFEQPRQPEYTLLNISAAQLKEQKALVTEEEKWERAWNNISEGLLDETYPKEDL